MGNGGITTIFVEGLTENCVVMVTGTVDNDYVYCADYDSLNTLRITSSNRNDTTTVMYLIVSL